MSFVVYNYNIFIYLTEGGQDYTLSDEVDIKLSLLFCNQNLVLCYIILSV